MKNSTRRRKAQPQPFARFMQQAVLGNTFPDRSACLALKMAEKPDLMRTVTDWLIDLKERDANTQAVQ